jgi:hypothetical protein
MNATATMGTDTLDLFTDGSPVLIGAALKGQLIRVLFHYGEDVATVHTAGILGTCSYARDSTGVPLVFRTADRIRSGTEGMKGIGQEIHEIHA